MSLSLTNLPTPSKNKSLHAADSNDTPILDLTHSLTPALLPACPSFCSCSLGLNFTFSFVYAKLWSLNAYVGPEGSVPGSGPRRLCKEPE